MALPPHHRIFRILLALFLVASVCRADTNTSHGGYEYPLTPFQLQFILYKDASDIMPISDMTFIQVTRQHLTKYLNLNPTFQRLTLYHVIQGEDEGIFTNGTKVAFSGVSYYSASTITASSLLMDTYLSFLGQNETDYVQLLRYSGWTQLDNVLLMSERGMLIDYDDGSMKEMGGEQMTSPEKMNENISMVILLAAIIIPFSILLSVLIAWGLYLIRNHVSWSGSFSRGNPEEHAVWQTKNHHLTESKRESVHFHRKQAITHEESITYEVTAGDGTSDNASTKATLPHDL